MDTFTLRGYGLSQVVDVHPAIQALAAREPVFVYILDERKTVNNFLELVGHMSSIAVKGDHLDGEAIAACRLFQSIFTI